ncbi:hypothetical protein [Leptospira yasudae]|uniref:hypothetical protein n=1 Tax=Leptospira yasudae TaxID=2202201 RepID=UPI0010910C3E|nr:hypothetical protein [Leptospira yasudae]
MQTIRHRLIQFPLSYLFIILSVYSNSESVFADTVILRNGIEYRNVKTVLGKSTVKIETEIGTVLNVPISSVKSIKSVPVQWQNRSKETAVDEVGAEESSTDKPQTELSMKSRSAIAKRAILESLPSLIPGWSNLFVLGYPAVGALFSVTELYLVQLISVYSKHSPGYYQDPVNLLIAYNNLSPSVSSSNPQFASLVFAYENLPLVKDPISGGYTTRDKILEGRERSISGLITVLLLDFSISQLVSMTSKLKAQSQSKVEKGSFDIRLGSKFRPEVGGELESRLSFVYYF